MKMSYTCVVKFMDNIRSIMNKFCEKVELDLTDLLMLSTICITYIGITHLQSKRNVATFTLQPSNYGTYKC